MGHRKPGLKALSDMISQLLRRFDFTVVNAERPVKNSFTGVLLQSDLNMRISHREDLQ